MLIKDLIWEKDNSESSGEELVDPLPEKLQKCVVSFKDDWEVYSNLNKSSTTNGYTPRKAG